MASTSASEDGEIGFARMERALTLSERVSDRLQDMILDGHLAPGERLPSERDLAERFGVSRTVIREAVRGLAGRGLVDPQSGPGVIVSEVHSGVVRDSMNRFLRASAFLHPDQFDKALAMIHEVRTTLETRIARLAADTCTREDLTALKATHEVLVTASTHTEQAEADVAFHRAIAVSTHNDLYVVLLDSISDPLTDIRLATLQLPGSGPDPVTGHQEILDAIVARDGPAAEAAMAAHLAESAHALERLEPEHLRKLGP